MINDLLTGFINENVSTHALKDLCIQIFSGVSGHVQQNDVKCIIMPLPRLSYIYWLIYFNKHLTYIPSFQAYT